MDAYGMAGQRSSEKKQPADSTQQELDHLLEQINRQQVKPEPHEVLAMALVLMLFIASVLLFSLAATHTL